MSKRGKEDMHKVVLRQCKVCYWPSISWSEFDETELIRPKFSNMFDGKGKIQDYETYKFSFRCYNH